MNVQQIRRTVVVGVDGSESALRAVRWGAAEAGRRDVPLRLMIAFPWVEERRVGHGHGESCRDALLARSRSHLVDAATVAERERPDVVVEQQLVVGHPIAVLGDEAARAHIVVIGDRGLGRIEGLLAGSVAVALAAHAAGPVVVVRGVEWAQPDAASLPVVVGVDGSAMSEAATAFAFEEAAARDVTLVAVHTWSDTIFEPEMAMIYDWTAVEADERLLLSERLAGWSEKYPDVVVEQVVVRDSPAHSLLDQAARAQLVVVGSRGRGEFAGMLLGSVSNAVVHRAPCPVAVVRLAQ